VSAISTTQAVSIATMIAQVPPTAAVDVLPYLAVAR
jgi:hypothetical protein